jgi:hypothetical protein
MIVDPIAPAHGNVELIAERATLPDSYRVTDQGLALRGAANAWVHLNATFGRLNFRANTASQLAL